MAPFHLHVEEWVNRDQVQVRILIGADEASARSTGMVVMALGHWTGLIAALEAALPGDVTRGPCQYGCGHPSHLADACPAGIFDAEGLPGLCGCVDWERR